MAQAYSLGNVSRLGTGRGEFRQNPVLFLSKRDESESLRKTRHLQFSEQSKTEERTTLTGTPKICIQPSSLALTKALISTCM